MVGHVPAHKLEVAQGTRLDHVCPMVGVLFSEAKLVKGSARQIGLLLVCLAFLP